MRVTIPIFRGTQPKLAPHLLKQGYAQIAKNCRLSSGALVPWYQDLRDTVLGATQPTTIFYYQGAYWLQFAADVNVINTQVPENDDGRFFFTGFGTPKVSNQSLAIAGDTYPNEYYHLGIPAPSTSPTAALGAGGSGDATERNYVVTFIRGWANGDEDESAPCNASNEVSAMDGQIVDLTDVPTCDSGYGVTKRRIYRSAVGSDGAAAYLFVGDISDNTTTTFQDAIAAASLGSAIATTSWSPPPDAGKGIIALPQGFYGMFNGKDVHFSAIGSSGTGIPYAWPEENIMPVKDTVVAIGVVGSDVVAATDLYPYVITGYEPSSMVATVLPDPAPCLSKRSFVSSPVGALYATNTGVYAINGGAGNLITKDILDERSWMAYAPESMHAVVWDNKYFAFYDNGTDTGCIVLDLFTLDFSELDLYTTAAYVYAKTGEFFFVKAEEDFITDGTGEAITDGTGGEIWSA